MSIMIHSRFERNRLIREMKLHYTKFRKNEPA